jgi:hypothetical protein
LEPVVDGASGQAEAGVAGAHIGPENWYLETDTKTDTQRLPERGEGLISSVILA